MMLTKTDCGINENLESRNILASWQARVNSVPFLLKMSKKKKTRQVKIIADLRRKVQIVDSASPASSSPIKATENYTVAAEPKRQTFFLPTMTISKPLLAPRSFSEVGSTFSTSYLKNDISKTAFLTLSIIAAQTLLFFFLRQHIVKIPGLVYWKGVNCTVWQQCIV